MKNKAKWQAAVTLLAVLALLLSLFAAACGGDETHGNGPSGNGETDGVTLKLSVSDGGSLEKTEYSLSAGDSLSEFLKDKTPTAEAGLEFAGWYEGNSPLASDRTMPAEGLTLTAKFYASYTALLYYDDGAGNYADTPDDTVTGKSIYGEAFSYVPAPHYTLDPAKESVSSSESLGKNETFTVYLLREAYTVTYLADAPEGVLAEVPAPAKAVYGLELTLGAATLQADSVKTYRFLGWSSEKNGSVEYAAGEVLPMPTADVTLYAVWEKGLADSMGGDDVIFLPADEPAAAYLLRNGFDLIKGDYSEETRIFTFKVSDEKSYAGRASADGETFAWYDAEAAVTFTLFQDGELATGTTLKLDGYDGAEYSDSGTVLQGVYSSDGDGLLYFSSQGKEFSFRVGMEEETDVFYLSDGLFGTYYSEDGESSIYVDGFGTLTDENGDTYAYTVESEDVISYSYFDDLWLDYVSVTYKLVTEKVLGYEIKLYLTPDGLEDLYTADDGGELVLDGFGGATYTPADGAPVEGFYTLILEDMDMDTYAELAYISVEAADGTLYGFKVSHDSLMGDPSSYEVIGNELGEYETLLAAGDFETATLLLDGDGGAQIIFPLTNGDSLPAFYGSYTEEDGAYRFTLTEVNSDYEDLVEPFRAQFEDFSFKIGQIGTLSYFSQLVESTKGTFTATNGTLVLDGYGTGSYTPANGTAHTCVYLLEETLVYLMDLTANNAFYLRLDGEKFVIVGEEAGTYYLYTSEDGGALGAESLFLDGESHAVLTYTEETGEVTLEGTYAPADDGAFTFTAEGKVFLFRTDVLYQGSSAYNIFTKQLEAEKVYTSDKDGTLIVDEYGKATWIDGHNQGYEGFLAEEDGILYFFTDEDGYGDVFAFAVLGDGTEFALLGEEWGEYYLLEKGVLREVLLELDGHGGAKLYDGDSLLSEGTYEAVDGTEDQFVYTPKEGEGFRFLIGTVYTNDGEEEYVYVAYHEEWDLVSHIDGDAWESLILDGYQTAYYTDERGYIRTYDYETLDETVLRLADLDAGAYRYYRIDRKEGTFSPIEDDYVLSDDGTVLLIYLGTEGSITLPETIVELGEDAFYGTEVTSVDLNNVEIVGESAFDSVKTLETLTATKVKVIGTLAFFMNIYLTEVALPSIESIGEAAFRYCESLTSVTLGANLKSVAERAFLNLSGRNGTLFVVQGGVFTVSADDPETTGATENEASFAENALFEVKDLATAQAFYADNGWTSYAAQICLKEEAPATFYTVTMSGEFVLDGRAKKDGEVLGVYVKTAAALTVYPYGGGAEQAGTFTEGNLTFGGVEYLPEGTEVTFTESGTENKLTFALSKKTTTATYNGESVPMTVGETIAFEKDHYTHTVTLHDDKTFTATAEFKPYTVTYKCGSNGSLDLTFHDVDKKNVTIGRNNANSIKIAGRSLRNFSMITFGTPVWIKENVYEFSIASTSTQNSTRSLPVVYKAVITLNDADSTFTYTSSIEFTKVPLEGEEVKLVVSYDNELKVSGVSLAFGETEENLTFEANEAGTSITITVAEGNHAGTYTAAITASTSALTLTKTA